MWKAKYLESTDALENYLNEHSFDESSLKITIFNKALILAVFKTER